MIGILAKALRFGPYAIAVLFGAWLGYHPGKWAGHREGVKEGREVLLAEQRHEAAKRIGDAENAEKALRNCLKNPSCLLQDDGSRRD